MPFRFGFSLPGISYKRIRWQRISCPFLNILCPYPDINQNGFYSLHYSQVEVTADARHRVRSCGPSPRVPCNKADDVRSACLNGKKMAIKMKVKTNKNISVVIFFRSMYILEIKRKKYSSPFFYE